MYFLWRHSHAFPPVHVIISFEVTDLQELREGESIWE